MMIHHSKQIFLLLAAAAFLLLVPLCHGGVPPASFMLGGLIGDDSSSASVDDSISRSRSNSASSSFSSSSAAVDDSEGIRVIVDMPSFLKKVASVSTVDDDDANSGNSASASSSSSSSSSEEVPDELLLHLPIPPHPRRRHFLENVANWQPTFGMGIAAVECGTGKFRSVAGQCHQCSICGAELYEREPCRADQDTRCESCLSEMAGGDSGTKNFDKKCAELVRIKELHRVLTGGAKAAHKKLHQKEQQKEQQQQLLQFPYFQFASVELRESGVGSAGAAGGNADWWRAEFAIQMAFYVALIALVLSIVRFLYKMKPTRAAAYRHVQVNAAAMPSAVLDELDQKQIIRAADAIRAKLGPKGYERLEEEFI